MQKTPFNETKVYGLVQILGIAIVVVPVMLALYAIFG